VAEYTLRLISSQRELVAYDSTVDDLLTVEELDFLLSGLVSRSFAETDLTRSPDIITEHFSKKWNDQRKYLVDWLIIVRILRSQGLDRASRDRCNRRLKWVMRKGNAVQKFYSGLLLKRKAERQSMARLRVGPLTYESLQDVARLQSPPKEGPEAGVQVASGAKS